VHSQRILWLATALVLRASTAAMADPCSGVGPTIVYFANGINTPFPEDAYASLKALGTALDDKGPIPSACLQGDIAYNRSDGAFLDLLNSNQQLFGDETSQFWRWVSHLDPLPDWFQEKSAELAQAIDRGAYVIDADLQSHVTRFRNDIDNSHLKVIVVAHSQGNFYANDAYNILTTGAQPVDSSRLAIIAVATPASFTAGGGPYTTLHGDIILLVPTARPANTDVQGNPCPGPPLPGQPQLLTVACHNFLKSYMIVGSISRPQIAGDVEAVLPPGEIPPPPPLAVDDSFTLQQDAATVIAASQLLANDVIAVGLTPTVLYQSPVPAVVSPTVGGDLSIDLTTSPSFVGPLFVNYFIQTSVGSSNVATITLNVIPRGPAGEPSGTYDLLSEFSIPPGNSVPCNPRYGVIRASDGNLYGTTSGDNCNNVGTVFRLDSAGVTTVLHTFAGGSDGSKPSGRLVEGPDGRLYGVTPTGGSGGPGEIFSVSKTGSFAIAHSFAAPNFGFCPEGCNPSAIILGSDGAFYGTAGGEFSNGFVIFRFSLATGFTVVHRYNPPLASDSGVAISGLTEGIDHRFYGTVNFGVDSLSNPRGGVVFAVDTSGGFQILRSFSAIEGPPTTGVAIDSSGRLYGGGIGGGTSPACAGIIFAIDPVTLQFTVVHCFLGLTDGVGPNSDLLVASDGNLYMTNVDQFGDFLIQGSLFSVTPQGSVTILRKFPIGDTGYAPLGALTESTPGILVGTTYRGGPDGRGTVFFFVR
jgi:uncharacterized repeat protein (TIGR03803 family)